MVTRMIVVVAALAGSAAAKGPAKGPAKSVKPTAAQALEVATKWADALESSEARPLTADAFTALVSDDGPESRPCPTATATDDAAIAKALDCAREHARFTHELKALASQKKNVPYLVMWKKQIAAAMKTATLVYNHGECAGQGDDAAIAVVLDKAGAPKVSAIYYASIFCGE